MANVDPQQVEDLILAFIEHDQFRELLVRVFKALPQADVELLMEQRKIRFIQGWSQSVFFPVPQAADYYLLILENSLLNWPESEQIYTVAHEMAHAYLDHRPSASSDPGVADMRELEADQQVTKWGFEAEVRQYGELAARERGVI